MSYTALSYMTLDQQASLDGVDALRKATSFRNEGKPESWARDVERKALRKFEHSFCLRHMFDRQYADRPLILPPSSYCSR